MSARIERLTAKKAGQRGLPELTALARNLPPGPARDLAERVLLRPYAGAYAAVLIAAQLGARSSWSGADELEGIGETITHAGLPNLGERDLYRAIADQFGIDYDEDLDEDPEDDEGPEEERE